MLDELVGIITLKIEIEKDQKIEKIRVDKDLRKKNKDLSY